MYRQNYMKNDPQTQALDFSSLRKSSNVVHAKTDGDLLLLQTQPNVALLLLAGFTLVNQLIPVSDAEFTQFNFEQVPKSFQQFQHEKTMNEIFNVIKGRVKSIDNFCEFFNYYPVSGFVLECWVRQKAKIWMDNNAGAQVMGNETEILHDLSVEIRGPLLGLIANCFGVSLKVKYDISNKIYFDVDPSQFEQEYGDGASKLQVAIEYRTDGFSSGRVNEKQIETSITQSISKTSQCGYLRRSKVVESQIEPRSGVQYKSVKKERGGACQKCGAGKKCECNTIKRKGLGVTPKSNQLSNSSSIGFKNDPFNLGFLNANNISKIRDVNRQK